VWPVPVRLRPEWDGVLSEAELAQAGRFRVEGARNIFMTSRAVQRLIGAHYLGVPPREVQISRTCAHCGGAHGRPRYVGSTIDYSVSHTTGWVILAAVEGGLVGVDVESTRTVRSIDDLARTVLTSSEVARLALVPSDERTDAFLRLWTRKEATVKLTGHGLAAPMTRIDVSGPDVVAHHMPAGWPDGAIHLHDVTVGEGHIAALATDGLLEHIVGCDLVVEG